MLSAARYLSPGRGAGEITSDTSSMLRTVRSDVAASGTACSASYPRDPGRTEQEPQCHNPRIERRWPHLDIGHVKLIGSEVIQRAVFGDLFKNPAKCLIARMWAFCALSPIP
jgi:hypothetical protein